MTVEAKRLLVKTFLAYFDSKSFILVPEIIKKTLLIYTSPLFSIFPKIIN